MAKCCAASLALHLVLLALILTCAVHRDAGTPPLSIDFTLSPPPFSAQARENSEPAAAAPKQTPASQKQPPVAVQTSAALKQEQTQPEPRPNPAVSGNAAPAPSAPQTSKAVTQQASGPVSSHQETQGVAAAPRGAQAGAVGGMTAEKAQQRYLKEHFTYIRDLIIKRLTYPVIARRMGWSGRVVLAFVVAEDGSVRSIQVRESSGYAALDNSAMTTVKNVAPFPRPPAAAEIVMPVQFQLR